MRTPNTGTGTWERCIHCQPGRLPRRSMSRCEEHAIRKEHAPPPHHLDRDIPRYRAASATRAHSGHAIPPRLGAQGTRTAPRSWRRKKPRDPAAAVLLHRCCSSPAAPGAERVGPAAGSGAAAPGRGTGTWSRRRRAEAGRGGLPAPPFPGVPGASVRSAARGPARPGGCVASPRRMGRRCSDRLARSFRGFRPRAASCSRCDDGRAVVTHWPCIWHDPPPCRRVRVGRPSRPGRSEMAGRPAIRHSVPLAEGSLSSSLDAAVRSHPRSRTRNLGRAEFLRRPAREAG
jgi:hypothetical protein